MKLLLIPSLAALYGYQDDVFRVETRVVNVEAIVRDSGTGKPVDNLAASQFRVKLDGKLRPVTYFQNHGGERRPLAMMIYFNLAPDGAMRQMSQQSARDSFARAIANLDPKDEVAVYASKDWFVGAPEQIAGLSVDRAESAAALDKALRGSGPLSPSERRQLNKDRDQSMTLAIDAAIELRKSRPDSYVVLAFISDGINTLDTMEARSREELSRRLSEHEISFSALTVDMLATYAAAAAVINPMGKLFGLSVTGAGEQFSRESGGVSIRINNPAEIGNSLAEITNAYNSRYSLGFQATEAEFRDRAWHKLEVRLDNTGGRKLILTHRKWWNPSLKPTP